MQPQQVLVVGRPGVGKSLLVAQLAAYIGLAAPSRQSGLWPGVRARRACAGRAALAVGGLPSVRVLLTRGRTHCLLALVDTPGLTEGPVADRALRRCQSLTLERLLTAAAVLHLVDTAELGGAAGSQLPGMDRELLAWGQGRPGYMLLGQKADLPFAPTGWAVLRREAGGAPAISVSARTGQGFGELRHALRGLLLRDPGRA